MCREALCVCVRVVVESEIESETRSAVHRENADPLGCASVRATEEVHEGVRVQHSSVGRAVVCVLCA